MGEQDEHQADRVFDSGALDCGSGLILLLRENLMELPTGGILEIKSTEATVETELPPWCRMSGHEHLSSEQVSPGNWRHFVRRGSETVREKKELESDRTKAESFKWSLRGRRTFGGKSALTIYSRNFSWQFGNSVDFDRKAELPSAIEFLFSSLVADLLHCFSIRCSLEQVLIDDLEGTINGLLHDPLAAAGIRQGDPSVKSIQVSVFVTSPAEKQIIETSWHRSQADSSVYQTMVKACAIETRLVLL